MHHRIRCQAALHALAGELVSLIRKLVRRPAWINQLGRVVHDAPIVKQLDGGHLGLEAGLASDSVLGGCRRRHPGQVLGVARYSAAGGQELRTDLLRQHQCLRNGTTHRPRRNPNRQLTIGQPWPRRI